MMKKQSILGNGNEYIETCESPVGPLTITANEQAVTGIIFGMSERESRPSRITETAVRQLKEYFNGCRKVFDLPLEAAGTVFQKKVWKALCDIPYGQTASYRQIAEKIDCPKGFRAVGMANNKNPISIVIPCHRVIGADGSLTGYGGGLAVKESLLQREAAAVQES